jgi:hypothetical protein
MPPTANWIGAQAAAQSEQPSDQSEAVHAEVAPVDAVQAEQETEAAG